MKITLVTLLFCYAGIAFGQELPTMSYEIDLTENLDTFSVTLMPDGKLSKSAHIYQFAATAPGTYQTMNIGRFISDFNVYDKRGKSLLVSQLSVNQFEIAKPQKVAKITYQVAETFDTKVADYPIYLMCGSSIEEDHSLINFHTMIGYFEGYKKSPIKSKIVRPIGWEVGTALQESDGFLIADNFDQAVDSPVLLGTLSYADTVIGTTPIEIYTFSDSTDIKSKMLLTNMSDMLDAARRFLIDLPVDHYTFLYYFLPNPQGQTGAWEHSYSSEYVMAEESPTPEYLEKITDIASHEFFHIVTPLNIHSEVVESFNFVTPTPSVHLWMYEGVTEWASNILLYRGGVVDEASYLDNSVARKILVDEKYFDASWSLKKISDESFNGGEGARQYGNIYYRGALVAGLLDIQLLDLSEGTYGLRELMLDLVTKYGKGRPVSEQSFFDDLVAMTYPEIRSFFDQYVLNVNPLPYEEYFAKIGLQLERSEDGSVNISKVKVMTPEQEKLYKAWSINLEVD